MKRYEIITASTQEGLVQRVEKQIEDGWTPIGGVDSNVSNQFDGTEDWEYNQAMILEEPSGRLDPRVNLL